MNKQRIKYSLQREKVALKRRLRIRPKLSKNRITVLNFHGVVIENELTYNSRFIKFSYFEDIIQFLTTEPTIEVVKLEDYWESNLNPEKLSVALTFDDGYANLKELVYPLLKQKNIPATFCVNNPSDLPLWNDKLDILSHWFPEKKISLSAIEFELSNKDKVRNWIMNQGAKGEFIFQQSTNLLWKKIEENPKVSPFWKRLSTQDLLAIAEEKIVSIVPHGAKHLALKYLNDEDLTEEVQNSIYYTKTTLGVNVSSYSLAYGDTNKTVINHLKQLGIDHVIGVKPNNDNILDRLVIHPHIDVELLKYFIFKGYYFG